MILYRLQISTGESWSTEWITTWTRADAEFKRACEHLPGSDIYLDEVEVPTSKTNTGSGRDNLAEALNRAHVSRELWPGRARHKRPSAQAVEDLLS